MDIYTYYKNRLLVAVGIAFGISLLVTSTIIWRLPMDRLFYGLCVAPPAFLAWVVGVRNRKKEYYVGGWCFAIGLFMAVSLFGLGGFADEFNRQGRVVFYAPVDGIVLMVIFGSVGALLGFMVMPPESWRKQYLYMLGLAVVSSLAVMHTSVHAIIKLVMR